MSVAVVLDHGELTNSAVRAPEIAAIDAEQILLGAILNSDGAALDAVRHLVQPSDFFEPIHRHLFEKLLHARDAGEPVDFRFTVISLGGDAKQVLIEGMTVGQYIARLAAEAVTILQAPAYAKLVRRYAHRRALHSLGQELTASAANDEEDPLELAASIIERLDPIARTETEGRQFSVSISEAAERATECMNVARQNGGMVGISTGLHDLDRKTNGLQRGELSVLAGRPGMGKTALGLSIALRSVTSGNLALYFSLEMTAPAVGTRAIADLSFESGSPIPYSNIMPGNLSNAEAEIVFECRRELDGLELQIEERGGLSVAQIGALARQHCRTLRRKGKALDVIVVDHMHLVRPSDRYAGNRVHELTEISGALMALAKELNVHVMALAQLSRRVEQRENQRPNLADLRDSGTIEQDADLVMLLYREAYYLEQITCADGEDEEKRVARLAEVQHVLECNIAKQRNGATDVVKLYANMPYNAIRDLARGVR